MRWPWVVKAEVKASLDEAAADGVARLSALAADSPVVRRALSDHPRDVDDLPGVDRIRETYLALARPQRARRHGIDAASAGGGSVLMLSTAEALHTGMIPVPSPPYPVEDPTLPQALVHMVLDPGLMVMSTAGGSVLAVAALAQAVAWRFPGLTSGPAWDAVIHDATLQARHATEKDSRGGTSALDQRVPTVPDVRASLSALLDEWAAYEMDPQRFYIDMPALHDKTGTVQTTVEYERALGELIAAVDELRADSPADDIATAHTLADQAWTRWHQAVDHAARVGLDDRSPTERRALQRLGRLVARLQNSPASDPELLMVKDSIGMCLDQLTTVSVGWKQITNLPGLDPLVRAQLPTATTIR